MKNLLLITFITFIGFGNSSASGYEDAVLKGIQMLQTSTTTEASIKATNHFERLAEIHTGEWLPLYYAAYGSLKTAFMEENSDVKDAYYNKGLSFIERAKAIKSNESEIYAMEGYIKLMYISNDAIKRAPSQTTGAIELLEKSKALNPSNPRPWFIHGQNTLFTPAFFGGGQNNAKPLLEKASS